MFAKAAEFIKQHNSITKTLSIMASLIINEVVVMYDVVENVKQAAESVPAEYQFKIVEE